MSTDASELRLRDAILIDFAPSGPASPALVERVFSLAADIGAPVPHVRAFEGLTEPRITAYLYDAPHADMAASSALSRQSLQAFADGEIEVSRLAPNKVFAGASFGQDSPHHYVVRTDVQPGGEDELLRWYDEEHMPGLASVPGTAVARRLVSLDAAPRYYACYDLTSPDALTSAPWLAVRATPWSDRVRPTFRNTRRIMYRRLIKAGP
jgi:hypothetical protein